MFLPIYDFATQYQNRTLSYSITKIDWSHVSESPTLIGKLFFHLKKCIVSFGLDVLYTLTYKYQYNW